MPTRGLHLDFDLLAAVRRLIPRRDDSHGRRGARVEADAEHQIRRCPNLRGPRDGGGSDRLLASLARSKGTGTVEEDDDGRRATDDKCVDEHVQRLQEALLDQVGNVGGCRSLGAQLRRWTWRRGCIPSLAPPSQGRPTTWGDDSSLPSSSRRGNCPMAILLEPGVLYMPSSTMYNAAMYTPMSPLARRVKSWISTRT